MSILFFAKNNLQDLVQNILSRDGWAKESPPGAIRVCEVVDLQILEKTYPGMRLVERSCKKTVSEQDKRIRTVDDLLVVGKKYTEYISEDHRAKLMIVVPHMDSWNKLQGHGSIKMPDLGPGPNVLEDDCLQSSLTNLAPALRINFNNKEGKNEIELEKSDIPMACFSVGQNSSIFDKYCKLAGTVGEHVVALDHPIRAHVSYMQAMGSHAKTDTVYKLLRKAWRDDTSDVDAEKLEELASHWQVLRDACPELPYMLDLDRQKAEEYNDLRAAMNV